MTAGLESINTPGPVPISPPVDGVDGLGLRHPSHALLEKPDAKIAVPSGGDCRLRCFWSVNVDGAGGASTAGSPDTIRF